MAKNAADDDFVARLIEDPERPPRVVVLLGWPGQSPKEDHVRIWFSPALTAVIDVPEDEILLQLLHPHGPFGLTAFWIRADFISRIIQRLGTASFQQAGLG